MIIAGFAGVGKTTFCNTHKNAIDFVAMPFKYENYDKISKEHSGESIKGHPDLTLKTDWRYDYYDALIKTQEKYPDEIIVIPTDLQIMDWLERDNIAYTLVYPCYWAQEEYRKRFIERGNIEEFIDAFIYDWDYWMEELTSRADAHSIRLKSEQYFSDVIDVSDGNRIIADKENYINKVRREISNFTLKDIPVENLDLIAVHKESGKRIEFNLLKNLETSDYDILINRECYFDEDEVGDIYFDNNPDNEYHFRLKRPNENKTRLVKPMEIISATTLDNYRMRVLFTNHKFYEFNLKEHFLRRGIEKSFVFNDFVIEGSFIHWNNTKMRIFCYQFKKYILDNCAKEIQ